MMRFLKGLLLGAAAGVVAGLMVTPKQRRRMMRSAPCRTLRDICCRIESAF